jgi:hypothetical protein
VAAIVSIGVRMNSAKILTHYNPETGRASEDGEAVGPCCLLPLPVSIGLAATLGVRIAVLYRSWLTSSSSAGAQHFRKPLFLAATYFMGKLFVLPFVGWPLDWPPHVRPLTLLAASAQPVSAKIWRPSSRGHRDTKIS